MPVVGTAGHVDHGKSTLIERLTGRDPDRWAEEKRRGLTIDLGFAWTTLPDGREVSFVDVPGHEKFLKNMLAGIEAIDVALFVVAADEGWMQQSEEHLAVVDLLDVSSGVVALTKIDLVENDLAELAALETAERLEGTSLAGSGVIPVSATTGEGIPALLDELTRLTGSVPASDSGRPRLWVDRSFSPPGAGTVVTGTLLDGPLEVDQSVRIYPGIESARIKGLQSHEEALRRVGPQRRVAINLSGIDRGSVPRGAMVGMAGQWDVSNRFSARVRTVRYVESIKRRGAYQLHIGASAQVVEIVGLEAEMTVLRTPTPIPVAVGDRFVIRDTGRKLVVAGGRVLDPSPGGTRKALRDSRAIDPDGDPDQIATSLLSIRGIDAGDRLASHSGGGIPTGARSAGDIFISDARFAVLTGRAEELVEREHETHPLRVGLPMATLAERLDTDQTTAELIVEESVRLTRRGPEVSVSERQVDLTPELQAESDRVTTALAGDLAVPTVGELSIDGELLHLLIRRGDLVRISPDIVLLPEQTEQIHEVLSQMPAEFTVADFRDKAGLSRKYAVPFLEWADERGFTTRRGDVRTLR